MKRGSLVRVDDAVPSEEEEDEDFNDGRKNRQINNNKVKNLSEI